MVVRGTYSCWKKRAMIGGWFCVNMPLTSTIHVPNHCSFKMVRSTTKTIRFIMRNAFKVKGRQLHQIGPYLPFSVPASSVLSFPFQRFLRRENQMFPKKEEGKSEETPTVKGLLHGSRSCLMRMSN